MKRCEECGKKLRLLESYRHPTLGKHFSLCSPCFDEVSESVSRWGEFVIANSFNTNNTKNGSYLELKKLIPNVTKIRDTIETELVEKDANVRGNKC